MKPALEPYKVSIYQKVKGEWVLVDSERFDDLAPAKKFMLRIFKVFDEPGEYKVLLKEGKKVLYTENIEIA